MATRRRVLQAAAGALLAACPHLPALAAVDVAGVKFDDTAVVAGQELKLNGAGLRNRLVFKIYAIGLYLAEKQTTVADILASAGPRRVSLTMLRKVDSDDFGKSFMRGLSANTDKAERTRILPQTMKFGEVFAQIPALKKGDQLLLDWLPGEGTQCYLNGKKLGEAMPEVAFYNAVLKIWLGDKPLDDSLKPALLGEH